MPSIGTDKVSVGRSPPGHRPTPLVRNYVPRVGYGHGPGVVPGMRSGPYVREVTGYEYDAAFDPVIVNAEEYT